MLSSRLFNKKLNIQLNKFLLIKMYTLLTRNISICYSNFSMIYCKLIFIIYFFFSKSKGLQIFSLTPFISTLVQRSSASLQCSQPVSPSILPLTSSWIFLSICFLLDYISIFVLLILHLEFFSYFPSIVIYKPSFYKEY